MLRVKHIVRGAARSIPTQRRWNSTSESPAAPTKPSSSAHSNFYKTFGRPIAKNFLIALCTYQLLYLSWLKLESLEVKKSKEDEIRGVEEELRSLTAGKSAA
ncbi:hypothetical protein BDY17DRAFT_312617 [Neohortaea acidophila]|uniref:Inner membrane assembly complex subunit 17 n=1 Tax=Neohortaea acidophila TaxID=245834 RepID=A0A6A6PM72_9PEZI|nr:uncharacterized protein BDY17DRAFT_312617 [Neohortaea acidophila]KAF2480791.1 hypothetical protein BDY17DRAFT_312617 [Neohortaea acidophila]